MVTERLAKLSPTTVYKVTTRLPEVEGTEKMWQERTGSFKCQLPLTTFDKIL